MLKATCQQLGGRLVAVQVAGCSEKQFIKRLLFPAGAGGSLSCSSIVMVDGW